MTVKEYINDVRMERARFLLECSDKRVYEIAAEVGFRDIDYFTRLFKKKTGSARASIAAPIGSVPMRRRRKSKSK